MRGQDGRRPTSRPKRSGQTCKRKVLLFFVLSRVPGLRLGLSVAAIEQLFQAADQDRDGYISVTDVVAAHAASARDSAWARRRSTGRRAASAAVNAAGSSYSRDGAAGMTWEGLVRRVRDR